MGQQMDKELTWASVWRFTQPNLDPVQSSQVLVMTLSNDDEWKQTAPLTSMGLQMDTELPLDLALAEPLPNVDLGHRSLVSDDSKH